MNRQQRRADEARAKMQRNAERVREIVNEANNVADFADKVKMLLFAYAREHGRVRIRASQIQALSENDRIEFISQPNGDVVVQYTQGAAG